MALSPRELVRKGTKLFALLGDPLYRRGLRLGVAAGVEHQQLLRKYPCRTLVDIGANRGQFALAARRCWPDARIFSFEPLPNPGGHFRQLFGEDPRVLLLPVGIGPAKERRPMHLSRKEDSSSLLPIGAQAEFFPGTEETGTVEIKTGPLEEWLTPGEIEPPAFLKIDVQGFEGEVLRGSAALLDRFAYVYVEASFVELYRSQVLADEVVRFLQEVGFRMEGVYNLAYATDGTAIQGDFLFVRTARQS